MTTQFITKRVSQIRFIALISVCCGAALTVVQAQEQMPVKHGTQYQVSSLPALGGTSSGGNSINNQSWVAGYSRLTGNQAGTLRCGETVRCSTSSHSGDQTAV